MKHGKLESPRNPLIREAVRIKEKRSRYRHEAFLVEGPHLIEMAVASGTEGRRALLKQVFYTEEFKKKSHRPLLDRLFKSGTAVFEVTERILLRLSDTETPQGIVAVASCRALSLDEITVRGFLVVCDGIQDAGNLGTTIRTADAAAADAVVLLPGTCDAFMPKTLRASAGSIFNIPVVYEERKRLVRWLKDRKIRLAVTAPDAGQSVFDADLGVPLAFVFGNEATGVSPELKKAADLKLKIPVPGKAESLNVASSAAVCLYEALRQRSGEF